MSKRNYSKFLELFIHTSSDVNNKRKNNCCGCTGFRMHEHIVDTTLDNSLSGDQNRRYLEEVDVVYDETNVDATFVDINPDPEEIEDMPFVGDIKASVSNNNHAGWFKLGTSVTYDDNPIAYQNAYNLFNYSSVFAQPEAGAQLTLPDVDEAGIGFDPTERIGWPFGSNEVNLLTSNLPEDPIPVQSSIWDGIFGSRITAPVSEMATGTSDGSLLTDIGNGLFIELNNTGSQIPVNIRSKTLNTNFFVFLGI